MDVVIALAGVVAGGTLIVAGVLKLSSVEWPADAASLGVGIRIARPVPFVEIALGAMVAMRLATPWTSIAMIALVVGFSLVIVRAMRSEVPPVCACFGSFDRRPVGFAHLARNGLLVALTAVSATG
jgi:hypothetical protein